ncbi:MAG TPA: TolC family outer membrane protein [Candidimonas sp.]|nr:TolC family outer membrane protein [Candidimonas sp.]
MSFFNALRYALAATTASFASLVWAQPSTLEQAVEKTIMTNPEIRAKFQEFQASLEGQNVLRGSLRPQVNVQGWTGSELRGSTAETSSARWNRHGYSLEMRQLLFDGFSTSNSLKQLGFEKLATYFDMMATVDQLALDAIVAYLDVQRDRELEKLARENYSIHETILAQLRERQESGVGRGVDLEQANGRLALAQTNLMTESNNLNDVVQRYRRIIGEFPAPTLLDAADVSAQLPEAPKDFASSLRSSSAILAKQALVQAAQAGRLAAQGRHSPTFEVVASTGSDREQPGGGYRDRQSTRVQLTMSYNLYRGGADSAQIRQSAAQSYAARDVRDYTCRNVQQDLSTAWNNIVRLRQQLPYLREHELAISKVRIAYAQQFQIGQRSLLDLLDTENELFDSRRALARGMYELKKAEYRWLALSHRVLPSLGLAQPYKDQPEEAGALQLSDESLQACSTPAPDTGNLAPVSIQYQEGMQPPMINGIPAAALDLKMP